MRRLQVALSILLLAQIVLPQNSMAGNLMLKPETQSGPARIVVDSELKNLGQQPLPSGHALIRDSRIDIVFPVRDASGLEYPKINHAYLTGRLFSARMDETESKEKASSNTFRGLVWFDGGTYLPELKPVGKVVEKVKTKEGKTIVGRIVKVGALETVIESGENEWRLANNEIESLQSPFVYELTIPVTSEDKYQSDAAFEATAGALAFSPTVKNEPENSVAPKQSAQAVPAQVVDGIKEYAAVHHGGGTVSQSAQSMMAPVIPPPRVETRNKKSFSWFRRH